jgi:hypothetical protein
MVRTTDAYMLALCVALDLQPHTHNGQIDWDDFNEKKAEVARQLSLLTPDEIRNSLNAEKNPEIFDWDFVLIDEGQDWPDSDRSSLRSIFSDRRLVVADGIDQFAQGSEHRDWTSGVPTAEFQIVPLRKSLRLKTNLCRFALAFAEEMGLLNWSIYLDQDIPGGRIKLFLRSYLQADHDLILSQHVQAGNHPIDSLFCLSKAHGAVHAALVDELHFWGHNVWDGTVGQQINDYPRDLKQLRAVQYESCRGLEGWTVVCLDIDKFFEQKQRYAPMQTNPDLLHDQSAFARRYAALQCLIPFTRAIDTLVIHASEDSEISQILLSISAQYPDFFEVYH